MPEPERAVPPPMDLPMVPFIAAGCAMWAIAGLVLLLSRDWLAEHGHGSWLGICLAGLTWGLLGLVLMAVHDRRRSRRTREITDRSG